MIISLSPFPTVSCWGLVFIASVPSMACPSGLAVRGIRHDMMESAVPFHSMPFVQHLSGSSISKARPLLRCRDDREKRSQTFHYPDLYEKTVANVEILGCSFVSLSNISIAFLFMVGQAELCFCGHQGKLSIDLATVRMLV